MYEKSDVIEKLKILYNVPNELKYDGEIFNYSLLASLNKMEIQTSLEVDLNNNSAGKKDFIVSEVYYDFDSQFELNKYEKKIMGIMTERLSEKIIIYLRTLE